MRAHRQEGGFTLIEMMTSVGILTVGMLAVVQLQGRSIEALSNANHLSLANNLASSAIEDLEVLDYGSLSSGGHTYDISGALTTDPAKAYFIVSWVIDVTQDPRNVTVTVTWGANHTLSLSSAIAR